VTVWVRRLAAGDASRTVGEAMLVELAAAYGHPGARAGRDPQGRPLLRGAGEALHVSMSHHRAWVAVALAEAGPVGVDIEVVRDDLPAQALADRWFDGDEARFLAGVAGPEVAAEYLRLWTVKEAVGKALGLGLRQGGMRRPVGPLPPWPASTSFTLAPLPRVEGVAAAGARYGDLLVAVASRAHDAVGALVAVQRDDAPGAGR
jgi:4'-phosphopantetheinyl transferase